MNVTLEGHYKQRLPEDLLAPSKIFVVVVAFFSLFKIAISAQLGEAARRDGTHAGMEGGKKWTKTDT